MDTGKIFITVGHPQSLTANVKKIPVTISENMTEKEVRQFAKKFREQFARHPWLLGFARQLGGFAPGDLYWALFQNYDDKKPVMASDNYFWRRK